MLLYICFYFLKFCVTHNKFSEPFTMQFISIKYKCTQNIKVEKYIIKNSIKPETGRCCKRNKKLTFVAAKARAQVPGHLWRGIQGHL